MTASWQIESEIATPYLLYISDGCAEGRCSRGKFGYKLESLFFFSGKKGGDIFAIAGCIFLSYLIPRILTFL